MAQVDEKNDTGRSSFHELPDEDEIELYETMDNNNNNININREDRTEGFMMLDVADITTEIREIAERHAINGFNSISLPYDVLTLIIQHRMVEQRFQKVQQGFQQCLISHTSTKEHLSSSTSTNEP